jgi:hypothetical protein
VAKNVSSCLHNAQSPNFVKVTELLASNLDNWQSIPGDIKNLHYNHSVPKSQSRAVGIVTGLRAAQSAVQKPVQASDFTLLRKVQTVSEFYRFSFPGLKRPGLVVNHTPPPNV